MSSVPITEIFYEFLLFSFSKTVVYSGRIFDIPVTVPKIFQAVLTVVNGKLSVSKVFKID